MLPSYGRIYRSDSPLIEAGEEPIVEDRIKAEGKPRHNILLANPSPKSFCHSIAQTYAQTVADNGQYAEICDLNTMKFDPVLTDEFRPDRGAPLSPWVEAQLEELAASAVVVLVYPIWFGGPPAILKGYVDRVLGAGVAVGSFQDGRSQRALQGKWLLTFTTSGTSLEWLSERGQQQSLRQGWDLYLERGFAMRDAGHVSIDRVVPHLSRAYADEQLGRVKEAATQTCQRLAQSCRAVDMAMGG